MTLTTEYSQEYQQAVSAYMNCRYDEARDITDRLAIGYPEDPNLTLLRGHIALNLQDLEAAKAHYKRVLTLTEDTEVVDCANNSLLGIAQQQGSTDSDSAIAALPLTPGLPEWDSEGVTAVQNEEQNRLDYSEASISQPEDAQPFNLETDYNAMNLSEIDVDDLESHGMLENLDAFSISDGVDHGGMDSDLFASGWEADLNLSELRDSALESASSSEGSSDISLEGLELEGLEAATMDDSLPDDFWASELPANLSEVSSPEVSQEVLGADFLSEDFSANPGEAPTGEEAQPYEPLPTYRIDRAELSDMLGVETEEAAYTAGYSPSSEVVGDEPIDDFAVLSLPVVDSEESLAFESNAEFSFAEPSLDFPAADITSDFNPAEFELDAFNPEAEFSAETDLSAVGDVQLPLRADEQPPGQENPHDVSMGLPSEEDSGLWNSELSGDLNWADAGVESSLFDTSQPSLESLLEPEQDEDHSLFNLVGAGERPSAGQQPSFAEEFATADFAPDDEDSGEDSLFGDYFDIPLPNVAEGLTPGLASEPEAVDISYGITEQGLPSGELGALSLPDIDADNNYSGSLSDWPYPASNSSGRTETFGLSTAGNNFDDFDGDPDEMGDATADLRMHASEAGMPDLPRLDTADLGAHLWENASEQFSFVNGGNSEVASQPSGFTPSAIGPVGGDAGLRPTAKANTGLDRQNKLNALITGAAAAVVGGFVALGSGMPKALPASILAGLTGGGATLLTGQRQVKRIKNATTDLQNQFSALIEGDFSAKADESGDDEFGQLATGFNQMTRVVSSVTGEARRKAEENEKSREDLQRQVIRLLDDVEGAARGDLTVQAEVSADVLGAVADSFNLTIHNLRKIVQQVKVAALQVNKGATENESFARTLSADALRQAEELAVTLNSVQMMTNAIQRVADSAKEANEVARMASDTALRGGEAVERTVFGILQIRETVAETTRKVKRLAESSQEISKIVNVIAQIASRTNLLALNASIEAARAGESGRGFAIVADEVRQLADRAAKASKEIEGIVLQIQSETGSVMTAMEEGTQQVIQGTKLAEQAKGALEDIIQVSSQIDRLVRSITTATVEQTETARSMAQVMQSVELTAQATSQEAQRVSNSLHQLATVSGDLQASVEKFKVEENQSI